MKKLLYLLPLIALGLSCGTPPPREIPYGTWKGELITNDSTRIPFLFEIVATQTGVPQWIVANGTERIKVDEVEVRGDSIFVKMPYFDSQFALNYDGEKLTGTWAKQLADNIAIMPFEAYPNASQRFITEYQNEPKKVTGNYDVTFISPEGDTSVAVGEFSQIKEKLYGTFLTTTGDYRFLEGVVSNDSIMLSCFDGSHAYLFGATVAADGKLINGKYYSGAKYSETWTAVPNPKAALPDLNTLTYLKPGFDKISFDFPEATSGRRVTLNDDIFKNKVTVVQIMGTWCPNCLDETAYFSQLTNGKFKDKNIAFVGLSYERKNDAAKAKALIDPMKKRLNITYPILFAGTNDKAKVNESLPMLSKVLGFPTTIIIDKKGKVRRIHTGYTGPATGVHYQNFTEEFEKFLEALEKE